MESSEGSISNRLRITVRGIVQGVGFRPFVYREAKRFGLVGYVGNTPEGVVIEVAGEAKALEYFIAALREKAPERSRIDALEVTACEGENEEDFTIRESFGGSAEAAIPLDTAICDACLREMDDPSDRRYRYPFINCTDCGPRYTIMQIPPYDRVRTSMKHFLMCDECRAEYTDPASRRYHAEPISCPACGPSLSFYVKTPPDPERSADPAGWPASSESPSEVSLFLPSEEEPISAAAALLKAGKIVALKGLGGFHLLCDATNDAAVQELRRRKHRPAKPLAVMFASLDGVREHARITDEEAALIAGSIKPIVIVDAKRSTTLSESIAPGIGRIGVFLPYTPLHRLLMEAVDVPLVATSANLSDEPILVRFEEIIERLGGVADAILDHDRPIVNPLDDAVVQFADEHPILLRMGRGYAPRSWTLQTDMPFPILALGAHQKSAIAPVVGRTMVLGGHIGDLGSVLADDYFERSVQTFKRFYGFDPKVLITDRHPEYAPTRYAAGQNQPSFPVQHHYAHLLACMAEYALSERVIGFAFDGTGLGEDGTLWGGEALLADLAGFERVGWLRPIALLGGEKAIREPRRIALSLLFECYSLEEVLSMSLPAAEAFLPHEIRQLHHLWLKGLNAPRSTSMGRLFDGVAALGGFIQKLDYEGQGGMVMENYADSDGDYPAFEMPMEGDEADWREMVRAIVAMQSDIPDAEERKRRISGRFLATIEALILRIADRYPDLPVVVGGGVFQNRALMRRLYRTFAGRRFYAQQSTPINDGGIALGQAWWAVNNAERLRPNER